MKQFQYDGSEASFLQIKHAIADGGALIGGHDRDDGEEPEMWINVLDGNGSRYTVSARPGEFVTRRNDGTWYVTNAK